MVARFLHCKVTFSSLSTLYSCVCVGGGITIHSPKWVKGCIPPPWRARIYINYLNFFCTEIYFSSLFIYSLIYISKDSWIFILYFKLQSNANLFIFFSNCLGFWELFLLVPLSLLSFNIPPITHHGFLPVFLFSSIPPSLPSSLSSFLFWNTSLLYGNTTSKGSSVFPSPIQDQTFLLGLVFFYWWIVSETKIWEC